MALTDWHLSFWLFGLGHRLPSANSHFAMLDASRATALVEEIELLDPYRPSLRNMRSKRLRRYYSFDRLSQAKSRVIQTWYSRPSRHTTHEALIRYASSLLSSLVNLTMVRPFSFYCVRPFSLRIYFFLRRPNQRKGKKLIICNGN